MVETRSAETETRPDADPRIQEWQKMIEWPKKKKDYSVRETQSLKTTELDSTTYRSIGSDENIEQCQDMFKALMAALEEGVKAERDTDAQKKMETLLGYLDGNFTWELKTCLPIVLGVAQARQNGTLCVLDKNAQSFLQRNLPYHRLQKVVEAITVILGPDSPWKRLMQEFLRVLLIMSPQEETVERQLLVKIQEIDEPQWKVGNDVREDIHALLGGEAFAEQAS